MEPGTFQGNVVLCGFMGSGKTTLGKLLARRMKLGFLDIDDVIVERAGMPVAEIFRAHGEQGFRDREHEAILSLSQGRGQVLATGGGALTYARNVEPLRQNGVIVYLNPGFEACYKRIAASDRPLVRSNTREQLAELYARRDALYRDAAQLELRMRGGPQQWAVALEELVRGHGGH